jgi:hypothetical protein
VGNYVTAISSKFSISWRRTRKKKKSYGYVAATAKHIFRALAIPFNWYSFRACNFTQGVFVASAAPSNDLLITKVLQPRKVGRKGCRRGDAGAETCYIFLRTGFIWPLLYRTFWGHRILPAATRIMLFLAKADIRYLIVSYRAHWTTIDISAYEDTEDLSVRLFIDKLWHM